MCISGGGFSNKFPSFRLDLPLFHLMRLTSAFVSSFVTPFSRTICAAGAGATLSSTPPRWCASNARLHAAGTTEGASTSATANAVTVPSDSNVKPSPRLRVYDVRHAPLAYDVAWKWQHSLMRELKQNPKARDALILLEHEPVYTLGTRSDMANVLEGGLRVQKAGTPGAKLVKTERGGEVTFHGPGQLVAYPVMNISRAPHKKDLHWYIRTLEQVIIRVVGRYGLEGRRVNGKSGVWVEGRKIAAVGLKVSKWITMHGIALNVDVDLAHFKSIVPCGLSEGVTSLSRECVGPNKVVATMDSVRDIFVEEFEAVFSVTGRATWDLRFMNIAKVR